MIRVENLYHSYGRNNQFQVEDVSFQVKEGEIFGFLGPNGAGKSTTQKIITGLLPLQRGKVEVAGIDIRKPDRKLFNRIGVSFEQPNLYKKLTGLENLAFFRALYDVPTAEPKELLKRFGLEDAANKRAGAYSKGMQQRLVLARSLLNNPTIWFLDEPTTGLDPVTAQEVKHMIQIRREEGTTIFLTTHDMHVAEALCDRVAFINEGKIVALDTPRALKLRFGEKLLKVEYRVNGRVEMERLAMAKGDDRQKLYQLMDEGKVETVHTQEASLEEVFIAVTGRGLI
jgi:fluoroquinolone transport system ATP-binding protein